MPVELNFELKEKFDNLLDYEEFKLNNPNFTISHTKYSNKCEICMKVHRMKIQYARCSSSNCLNIDSCGMRYKICTCLDNDEVKYQKRFFYTYGQHNNYLFVRKQRGITRLVKDLIEDVINLYDTKPKRIEMKLYANYKSEIDVMPTLEQIQTYIKNRRKMIGECNSIDMLNEYVSKLHYNKKTEFDQLFVFGDEIGNGTDENHFHLGFTSLKLLKRIDEFNNRGCYHIDATYKIIKYSYPMIVFGFSDIQRQFYPVCFMFTSHEQQEDYDFFFDSFLRLCEKFKVNFKPKYIVGDGSKAIANSVRSHFKDSLYIMCWFHLRMNVKKKKNLIPADKYATIMKEINELHMSKCEASYKLLLRSTLGKWRKDSSLIAFHDYFKK